MTSCSGCDTGSLRRRIWSISVNMAVFAPFPRASDRIATVAKSGLRRRPRKARRTSDRLEVIAAWTESSPERLASAAAQPQGDVLPDGRRQRVVESVVGAPGEGAPLRLQPLEVLERRLDGNAVIVQPEQPERRCVERGQDGHRIKA